MADDLNLRVRLKDDASKGFEDLSKQVERFGKQNESTAKIIQRHMAESSARYKNASQEINKMAEEMKTAEQRAKESASQNRNFANALKQVEDNARKSQAQMRGFSSSLIKGGLALTGMVVGLQQVGQFLRGSVQETLEYRNAVNATTATVRAFGLEEQQLLPAVQSLTQDGLLTQADAYRTLSSLLAGGLNVEQATDLITSYKDVAAFGRDTTLSFADAVKNNAEAFLTESSILGNRAGLQENFNQILELGSQEMGKSVSQLTAAERAQAKYIGTQIVAQRATGNSAKMANTFQGSLLRMQTSFRNAQQLVGSSLVPVLNQLFEAFNDSSEGGKGLAWVVKGAGTVLTGFVGVVRILTTSLGQMAKAAVAAMKDVANAFKTGQLSMKNFTEETSGDSMEMLEVMASVQRDYESIWNGMGDSVGSVARANNDWMNENADSARKMADDIAKEMTNFNETMRQMSMQFDESMRDLVISHKERVKEIEKDLSEENERFKESMSERKSRFDDAMKDIEDRHSDKTKKIIENIDKEKAKTAEQVAEIKEEYALLLTDLQRNGENRIAHLTSQLDKEKARESTANKERIAMLQRMIDEEKVAIEGSVQAHEALKEDEINDELAKRDEKIAEIQADLDEENQAYAEAKSEREAQYVEETENLKKEHEKRTSIIQDELNKEREIQRKHAEDFAKFKDAVAEDDISRLKRKNAMERAEEERAHRMRLEDIQRRVSEANTVASGGGVASSTKIDIPEATNNAQNMSYARPQEQQQQSTFDKIKSGISNAFQGAKGAVSGLLSRFPGFAEGGEFEVGGNAGIDQNLVAFRASRGERVRIETPSQQNSGSTTIHAPITVMNSEMDMDMLIERLAWQVNKSGIGTTR